MGYAERNTWAQLIAGVIGTGAYLVIVLPQFGDRAIGDVDWAWPMVWCIAAAIVLSIVLSVLWGIAAGMRDPELEQRADQRDREIEWFGDRIGQAFLVLGGLGGLVLAMTRADWFWIGNAIFAGFVLSAILGGIARLVAYRRGFQ